LVCEAVVSPAEAAANAPSFQFAAPECRQDLTAADGFVRDLAEALLHSAGLSGSDPDAELSAVWQHGLFQPVPAKAGTGPDQADAATPAAATPATASAERDPRQRDDRHVRAGLALLGLPEQRLADVPRSATAEAAAAALGVPHRAVIKSLAVMVGGAPALVLVPGGRKMDFRKLGDVVAAVREQRKAASGAAPESASKGKKAKQPAKGSRSKRKARMAKPDECIPHFGFTPGSFAPIGVRGGPGDPGDDLSASGETQGSELVVVVDAAAAECCVDAMEAEEAVRGSLGPGEDMPAEKVFFAGGGTEHHMVWLTMSELHAKLGATVAEITIASAPSSGGSHTGASPSHSAGAEAKAFDPDAFEPSKEELSELFPRPRFFVDSSLGRLTRWLRVVGIDTEERSGSESAGAALARATSQRRLFVTRDFRLAQRKGMKHMVLLLQNDTGKQFEELTRHCGLTCSVEDLMSRCSKCNGRGYRVLSRARVLAKGGLGIHPKVLSSVATYFQCLHCAAMYWAGPKFDSTRAHFAGLVVK
jgi:uncharacterized protein with PIN domain/prolyl-tRNA editing enzyme YbaK/EbsC (Cys-tRNA(Pro) deacylase)